MLVVIALAGFIISISTPHLSKMAAKGKVRAATREMTALFREARYEAVSKKMHIGFEFQRKEEGFLFCKFQDGNSNGIRRKDIKDGKEILLGGPYQIKSRYGNIDFSILKGKPVSKIPPGKGKLDHPDDPIKFGRSDIISFSPSGNSSSGSIYISDGNNLMMAIVIFGPTVRIRVWDYDYENNKWRR